MGEKQMSKNEVTLKERERLLLGCQKIIKKKI